MLNNLITSFLGQKKTCICNIVKVLSQINNSYFSKLVLENRSKNVKCWVSKYLDVSNVDFAEELDIDNAHEESRKHKSVTEWDRQWMQLFKIKHLRRLASTKADNEEKIGPSFHKLKKNRLPGYLLFLLFCLIES